MREEKVADRTYRLGVRKALLEAAVSLGLSEEDVLRDQAVRN